MSVYLDYTDNSVYTKFCYLSSLLMKSKEGRGKNSYITLFNLGLGVMPGILPRLATGLPSTSWRSAVKSIGLVPVI